MILLILVFIILADVPDHGKLKQNSINMDEIVSRKKALDISMTQSDTGLTTWRQIKKTTTDENPLQRYDNENGNNNNSGHLTGNLTQHAMHCAVRKSTSMPNLKEMMEQQQLNVSQVMSNASMDSISKLKTMLPMLPNHSSEGTDSTGHHMNNSSIR